MTQYYAGYNICTHARVYKNEAIITRLVYVYLSYRRILYIIYIYIYTRHFYRPRLSIEQQRHFIMNDARDTFFHDLSLIVYWPHTHHHC